MEQFFDLPWPSICGFVGTLSLILFTFGPRIPLVGKWFSESIQNMLGVTGLRGQLHAEHLENQRRFDMMDVHILDKVVHR